MWHDCVLLVVGQDKRELSSAPSAQGHFYFRLLYPNYVRPDLCQLCLQLIDSKNTPSILGHFMKRGHFYLTGSFSSVLQFSTNSMWLQSYLLPAGCFYLNMSYAVNLVWFGLVYDCGLWSEDPSRDCLMAPIHSDSTSIGSSRWKSCIFKIYRWYICVLQ